MYQLVSHVPFPVEVSGRRGYTASQRQSRHDGRGRYRAARMRPSRRHSRLILRGAVALLLAVGATACGGSPGADDLRRTPGPAGIDLGSVSTSGAGHRFFEVYEPAGPARGTMIVLHGGGWADERGDARRKMALASVVLRAQGWRVVNAAYSPPARSGGATPDPRPGLRDVVAFYDQVRRAYRGPVCSYGESAGGHLAVMLALERPRLSCAVSLSGPLDLPGMFRDTSKLGRTIVRDSFGTDLRTLDAWSPTRSWSRGRHRTPVFATGADDDPLVPGGQPAAFRRVAPATSVVELRSERRGAPYVHGPVREDDLRRSQRAMGRWLDRIAPAGDYARPREPADDGADCSTPGGARPTAAGRTALLAAGGAWRQAATPGAAATHGCSGSARRQEDGLSLWVLPALGTTAPAGTEASLTLGSGRPLREVRASLRGFLARPAQWGVGLYASGANTGPIDGAVAACDRARCRGLTGRGTDAGLLIAAPGTRTDPDGQDDPVESRYPLPAGTRRIAWRLVCTAPSGCDLAPPDPVRDRDPLAHPAILSIDRVEVR